ncbi:diguanylate cyclase/phosphodiesterase [Methylobacterium sp. 4-46]|uniref:putative bifunctional diguanylate cyclase/phosphodiesterase n=1 Tax=unclassified Methylobacterium TaxID=2615210 RepID=UPI000165CD27|nr:MULTISPECIES: EAL domain-containing protein [Methylobacterium]ACA20077.1 diguanylate cyclase/phosphodiesterase [Methylobacterium sp. 4-46]WFT79264.1 EAL domain-containing protein [Methylobacterium nodulans]
MQARTTDGATSLSRRLWIAILLIGAGLAALSATLVAPAVTAFLRSRHNLAEIAQFARVLEAANRISAERGPANVAMSQDPAGNAAALTRLREFREATDRALAQLHGPDDPDGLTGPARRLPADLIDAAQARLRAARREVDEIARMPAAARGADQIRAAVGAMIAVVDQFQDVVTWEVRTLRELDPALAGQAMVARAVSDLREHGGRIASFIVPALAVRAPLGEVHLAEAVETRGRLREIWQLLQGQIPAALDPLMREVESRFLGEGLGTVEAVIAEGRGPSGRYSLDAQTLTARYVPTLKPLEDLRTAFLARMNAASARERDGARDALAAAGLVTLAALALIGGLLGSLRASILRPLLDAREAIVALAGGVDPAPVRAPMRVREIALLFDALLVLQKRLQERANLMQTLRRQAETDGLTGLYNRRALTRDLATLDARPAGGLAGLLLIDVDGFKRVNDSFGHAVGDVLLRLVGQRLQGDVGGSGLVARIGADEFAVLLPDLAEPAEGERTADRILGGLAEPFRVAEQIFHLDASIGVAVAPHGQRGADDLLARADMALHEAKRAGQHCRRVFRPEMRRSLLAWTACQQEMPRALAEGEFVLFYQPQLRLRDRTIAGAEALIRWRHPERGLLAPADFLAPLESSRAAEDVGRFVLRTACAEAAGWRRRGLGELRVAVNLFSRQFLSRDLVEEVRAALAEAALPASALELEITETIILQHDDALIPPLRALRDMGVGLAFDDYGTGYASLSLLKRFPLTRLKIDRSFVRGIPDSAQDLAIVRSVVALGRSFGLEVTAEGIETPAMLRCVTAEGCQEGQGYLFGQPMAADLFAAQCWAEGRRTA